MSKTKQTQQTESWGKEVYKILSNLQQVEWIMTNAEDSDKAIEKRLKAHVDKVKVIIRAEIEAARREGYEDGFAEGLNEGKEYADEALGAARREVVEEIVNEYGRFNDGCGCCADTDIKTQLKQKYLTNDDDE